ncbi:actin [Reticulomyxa filosa]|uniref:Actin n=1 Tax=Reticulomyxa filosa TaxID=46433 RepID=X6LIZ3_RETFI|nr:actin [Reticulomyxa filosa]|eukprot:ETO01589.1 actin [Reticulomyxa filosa]
MSSSGVCSQRRKEEERWNKAMEVKRRWKTLLKSTQRQKKKDLPERRIINQRSIKSSKKIDCLLGKKLCDINEKLSYVALDCDNELKKAEISREFEQNYELSDEVLFKPNFIVFEQEGLHKLIFQSIMKCDPDIRKDLCNNIVISGGTAMFNGIAEKNAKGNERFVSTELQIRNAQRQRRSGYSLLSWPPII